jgi:hypothetical protein
MVMPGDRRQPVRQTGQVDAGLLGDEGDAALES